MNASELALLMLTWEEKRKELDKIEDQIKTAVMELGKTQTVGNVRATYSKGKGEYDYQRALLDRGLTDENLSDYAKITYDYRKAVMDMGIEIEPYYTPGKPHVSVKLID